MGEADNNSQPSKKRAAGIQLSKDNPGLDDNEETSEQEAGTFKGASDEVLASRKIVKVRCQQTPSISSAAAPTPASNPFAAIRLVPTDSPVDAEVSGATDKETEQTDANNNKSENKVGEVKGEPNAGNKEIDVNGDNNKISESEVDGSKAKLNVEKDKSDEVGEHLIQPVVEEGTEGEESGNGAKNLAEADHTKTETDNVAQGKGNDEEKNNKEYVEKHSETSPFSSFQQLSSGQNAFTGLAFTGFSSSPFSFGSVPKDGSPGSGAGFLFGSGSSAGSLFGLKNDQPSFGFGVSNDGNSSLFGTSGSSSVRKNETSKFPPMQEVPLETGEENEKAVFTADSVLFEFTDGLWKGRGKGELKVNISTTGTGKARLIMRARGNYRLILNASIFPDMKLTNMEKKGITFACMNSAGEGKDGLSTIALKFKDASLVEDFRAAVMEHKANSAAAPTDPDSSPKPSND